MRYTFLLDLLGCHMVPVMFVGPTGTGKSVYVQSYLLKQMDPEKWAAAIQVPKIR